MEEAAKLFLVGVVFLALVAGLPLVAMLRQARRDARSSREDVASQPDRPVSHSVTHPTS